MKKIVVGLLLMGGILHAQTNEEIYAKALKLKDERSFKEALPYYQRLLKSDSLNVDYLAGASLCYSQTGFLTMPTEAEKMKYFRIAEYLSKKAIALNNNSAEAHYTYAVAVGRINENGSTKQKIACAKLIRTEADLAVKLNPRLAGAHHVLGRWHKSIAGFSAIERMAVNALYGGLQAGSYEEALKAFTNAILAEPKYKMHMYELADTYYQMGKKAEAKVWVTKMLSMPNYNEFDRDADVKGNTLLKKLQ
jgi:tetratricopeptide (TPR) repeat protein